MKIAHVTATFPPYAGGTGQVCFHNAVGLAQRGHAVAVYTADHPPGAVDYPPEITVHRLAVRYRVGNAPLLPGLLRLRDVDIVHLHYPFVFGQELVFINGLGRRIPYVITYHQDLILNGLLGRAVRWHHRLIGQAILKRARRLLVTSLDYGAASRVGPLLARYPQRVMDLPNGVDVQRFHPSVDGRSLNADYRLPADAPVILFVGGLDKPHYFKGVDVLLDAFSRLQHARAHLLIVGDGDLRPTYEAQAVALGIADRVTFCGRVSDAALPLHYARCDLVVLPSTTMGEAFGMVLIEGMASGKAVIGSRLPGVRSVISECDDGRLCTPGDALDLARHMDDLLAHPQARADMGRRGRAKVERLYAWPQIIKRLETLYTEICAHGTAPS